LLCPGRFTLFPPAFRRCFDLGITIPLCCQGRSERKTAHADNGGNAMASFRRPLQPMREI
jgi:hypothetical protein